MTRLPHSTAATAARQLGHGSFRPAVSRHRRHAGAPGSSLEHTPSPLPAIPAGENDVEDDRLRLTHRCHPPCVDA